MHVRGRAWRPPRPGPPTPSGFAAAGVYALVLFFSLLQQPGLTTYDTRAELTERPLSFLREAFTLWHPESTFGEFQNQAYGYLFPQGSFFVLAEAAGMADWVAQRLWSALVLVLAIEGARRVAGALGLTASTALVAGLAYGFTPRLLGTVPVLTGEALPGAMLPWVVLPLLLHVVGRVGAVAAVLLSAAAVVCMGGVNAVENAGSLPLAGLLVLWMAHRRLVRRRFVLGWGGAVAAASTWWAAPLLVLAGYAPPFYEYVESAADTTALIGWSEASRGSTHWVAYLVTGDQPWWPAANALVSEPGLVVLSAVLAGGGLVGLALLDHPVRRPLAGAALLGLAALTVAHVSWEGSPLGAVVRTLLDGPLQIFRNVHKIDPTVRLPLAIGLAHAITVGVAALLRRAPRLAPARTLVLMVPVLAVVAMGGPYLEGRSRTPGWEEVSKPWQQARAYLAEHDQAGAALVVPGSGFAQQGWGWTLDEPLLLLGGTDRVVRTQVPLVPGQTIRFLSALDALVTTGKATPALADQLARAGIAHLVVRRDLDRSLTSSPHPGGSAVSAAQAGLRRVAAFGDAGEDGPEVEVLAVPPTALLPRLRTTEVDDVVTVRGAPGSVLALQEAGLVAPGRATVLDGEPGWEDAVDVVTDGDQRRERAFGANDDGLSAVLGPTEEFRTDRAAHDFPTVPDRDPVVARHDGLDRLTASSSQGYADNFGAVVPQAGPAAAVDGDPRTRWVTSPATDPREQWLRLELAEPRPVRRVEVLPVVQDEQLAPPRVFEVAAGGQVVRLRAHPSGAPVVARFDGRSVDAVEVRIVAAGTRAERARVGLREVEVDGESFPRTLVLPREVDAEAAWSFGTPAERRACVVTLSTPDCSVARIRAAEEPGGLDRTMDLEGYGAYDVSGWVVARGTREAARLLEPLDTRQQVGASSVYGDDPRVSSRFSYDGQPTTAWVSSPQDPDPTLLFRWAAQRRVTGIQVVGGETGAGPVAAVVSGGDRSERLTISGDEVVRLDRPFLRRSLDVTFVPAPGSDRVVVPEVRLVGARIERPFVAGAPTGARCGLGPRVQVDGRALHTRVRGTLADVVNGTPLRLTACRGGRPGTLALGPGEHRVAVPPTAEFQAVSLTGVPPTRSDLGPTQATGPARAVEVTGWSASRRTASVGPGAEALVHLPENANPGWVAELDGDRLDPVRVDGWQQGWRLPPGEGGALEMRFAPQQAYAVLLPAALAVSGSVLLAGLGALLLQLARRRVVGGTAWSVPAPGSLRPAPTSAALAVAVTAGVLVLGPVVGAATAAGVLLRLIGWRVVAPALAGGGLVVLAAVIDVLAGPGWTRSVADALAAAGCGLALGLALARRADAR